MGDVSNKLRENARFLERKGWSKSAVLENAGAAELDRLAADNERLQRELAEAQRQLLNEQALVSYGVQREDVLRNRLQAAREAMSDADWLVKNVFYVRDNRSAVWFDIERMYREKRALAPPADAKGEAE